MMKSFHFFYKLLTIIALVFVLQTCEDPIGFDRRKEDTLLVVDGRINAADSVQTVLLTRTAVVGRSARFPPEPGATVTLIENKGQEYSYEEVEAGVYKLSNFKPTIGNTYQIDIQLENKNHYVSQLEILPQSVPIDSAYFTFDGLRNLTLFSKIPIPVSGEGPYLRWHIQQVYQHTDLYCGDLDDVRVCYYNLERATDNQLVPLLDGGELERGVPIQAPIVTTPLIDTVFGEITFYTVYQEALTLSTFRYWEKVNLLLSQTGSIFDAPPGQIRGNISNVNDPNELVLGLFYATYEDIAYVKTYPGDFAPLRLNPYCGIQGLPRPNPFPEDCCVCRPGIPRPAYWK